MHAFHNLILDFIMIHMSPPNRDIGILQGLFRQAMLRFIQGCCFYLKLVFGKKLGQLTMNSLWVHFLNGFFGLFMTIFIPYGDLNHE
ncbi:hypothetical protein D3C76_1753490 [compost metagenome]